MSGDAGTRDGSHAPALVASLLISPAGLREGAYQAVCPHTICGEITILIECTAAGFPFERYCRFASRRNTGDPNTFASLEFRDVPGGVRVGPWPGWRGIPHFPRPEVLCGTTQVEVRELFFGDEITTAVVRYFGRLVGDDIREIAIQTPDPRIIPLRMDVYKTSAVVAVPRDTGLSTSLLARHPRLLITADDIPLLRERVATSHKGMFEKITGHLASWDLPFELTPESKLPGGKERISPEDRLLVTAFLAMAAPGREQTEKALQAYSAYLAFTRRSDFEPLRIDTQSGEVLFLLCAGYDWLVEYMSPGEKEEARQRLYEIADVCFAHLGYGRRDYAQAHYLGCGLGLLAFAFLFWEEHPRAQEWGTWLRGVLDAVLRMLPSDGSYPHGINLWIYEFGFLLRWIEIIRTCTGENLWAVSPGLSNATKFRAATLSPDGRFGITMGDPQYRTGGDSWCHYLIAARTGSRQAQWLGNLLSDLPHDGIDFRNAPARRRVYECLFFDPDVEPEPFNDGTTYFGDIGQLCIRTPSTVFTFRSGPPIGMQRYGLGEYGAYGHSDPANGSFLLYHNGTFAACGSGPVYRRDTLLHNVVTIDGQGQIGDSSVWLPDFIPPELLALRPEVRGAAFPVSLSVDLTSAYFRHLGLLQYRRSVCVHPDAYIAGVDIVRCSEPRSIAWHAHAWTPFDHVTQAGSLIYMLAADVRLVLFIAAPVEVQTAPTSFVPAYPNDGRQDFHLVAQATSRDIRFAWCYVIGRRPVPRCLPGSGLRFTMALDHRTSLMFDGSWLIPEGAR